MSPRIFKTLIGIAIAIAFAGRTSAGLLSPLNYLEPAVHDSGQWEARIGFKYYNNYRRLFYEDDVTRELWELPSLDLTVGVSEDVELIFSFPALLLQEEGESSSYGQGDLRITGIYNILSETEKMPAISFMQAVKLPNARDEDRLGTDETDFYAGVILSRKIGTTVLTGTLGLGILSNPLSERPTQDDVLFYDVSLRHPITKRITLGYGFDGFSNSRFGNHRSYGRVGLAYETDPVTFDVDFGAGVLGDVTDYTVCLGFTFDWTIQERIRDFMMPQPLPPAVGEETTETAPESVDSPAATEDSDLEPVDEDGGSPE